MKIIWEVALIIFGFLCGSLMFSQWIPKIFLKKDICKISVDNNPGAFNAIKHCGKGTGMLCLFLDVIKGFLPVFLGSLFFDSDGILFSLIMFAPALGHALGLFNHLRGGKCIAVSFGIMLGVMPVAWIAFVTLAAFYIIFSTVARIKNAAKRSVFVYLLFMVVACVTLGSTGMAYVAIGCGLVAMMPVIKFVFSPHGLADNKLNGQSSAEDCGCSVGENN